uniref:Beta-1,4-galactosyltransferase n=1 Tax=Trichobilharzia regenti TaxID=157069 RepID=A0AA85J622_TRIRE|nr:unnamed protein product [Trichobilharzia regenti]CAH8872550.1 unnamed protein product [Trichobilharzia regenti]CAH8872552.1 unnamed protein product [Trichobilharzia regenti]
MQPSWVSSPLKLLILLLIFFGFMYVFYLVGMKSDEHGPIFVVNYTSVLDNQLKEVGCYRLKYDQVGRLQPSLNLLTWPQLEAKYASSQPRDYIVLNNSAENSDLKPLFGSLYTRYDAALPNVTSVSNESDESEKVTEKHSLPKIWTPMGCSTSMSSAIIIPYRNRDEHLRIVTNHLHAFIRHQKIPYTIFVIEQTGKTKFNRGALLNAGFLEVSKLQEYSCFILHDVDKLPEDDRLTYTCNSRPTHFSSALSQNDYKVLYRDFFGGVVAFTREQFLEINGFSNLYEGWGGEDDDLLTRVSQSKYGVFRISTDIGRYYTLSHATDKLNEVNPDRYALLKNASARIKIDGLNTLDYSVISSQTMYNGLLHWISLDIPSVRKSHL